MNRKRLFYVWASLAIIMLVASSAYSSVKEERVPTVVVKRTITSGTLLVRDMLAVEMFPQEKVENDAFRDINQVEGKILSVTLLPGEQVRAAKLGKEARNDLGTFTFKFDTLADSGGGLQRAGDKVAIWIDYDSKTSGVLKPERIIEEITVASVRNDRNQEVTSVDDYRSGSDVTKYITVWTTPEQTAMLREFSKKGKFFISIPQYVLEKNGKGVLYNE